ncbi:hypothetical protein SADUNF_Sadunf05G0166100 [Salix dunnii]|uniref:Uncharacterized protein n=1 Tax=Salix dunnii TaxID=1413687 RepID=A0A835K931_9ROSI|nr:hypothetical protein SADUNF_Sadunf05G0166100 [Salix dunnii]
MGRYHPQQGGALEYRGRIMTLMLFPPFCSLSAMTGSPVWSMELLLDKLDRGHQLHDFSIQLAALSTLPSIATLNPQRHRLKTPLRRSMKLCRIADTVSNGIPPLERYKID